MRSPPHIATLVIMAGGSVMAMNIFLPMLPSIGADLGVGPATSQLVLTVFLASTAIAQLFIGPMSDRFGRRPVLLWTTVIFLVATLICVFATSIEMLIFGRVLQATIASSIALSRAIIRDLYDRSKAASMIGYVTMAMAVIPMVSPSIGGYLGETFGWRATFVTLFIVALAILVLIYFDLGETHSPTPTSALEQVRDYLLLLREPALWGYVSVATLGSGAYFAFLGGAPFVGVDIVGMSPTRLGAYFALVAVGYMFGNFISGRYSQRFGIEPMMLFGGLVCAAGVGISLSLMGNLEPKAEYLFVPMMLVGCGNGMMLPNANAGAISVRPDLAGSASGITGFLQIGGGALLAAASGALITVENQALPLYTIMFVSSVAGAVIAFLMFLNACKRNV